jgi:hypothetical protein
MARSSSGTAGQQPAQLGARAESQGVADVPSSVHRTWLAPLPRIGHEIVSQAPEAQVRSHWQAASQSMLSHALVPLQLIVQREFPAHVMSLQLPSPLQLIAQFQPDGQVITPSQSPGALHSTVHVRAASSHEVQSLGQFCSTQKPPVHVRLPGKPAQSAVVLHARSSDGRSTMHATITAPLRIAPTTAARMSRALSAAVGRLG